MTTLAGFHHVKLPVRDVAASRDWYRTVLGFDVDIEFVEHDVLMGVAMRDPDGCVCLALRHDPVRAESLAGFDPVALAVATRADLEAWQDRLDTAGHAHGGIVAGHEGWVLVGLHDPDRFEPRLYTIEHRDRSET
ncbi:VOC family protein [Ilumatobacter nonamiensis]|uniref:VOC family protein n=1 Tax=Ilumatobacter nonamiensis TaxID=467093 RepID=UPI000345142E|nr:VOC family protein [Ilumatobacter nonamiensis]